MEKLLPLKELKGKIKRSRSNRPYYVDEHIRVKRDRRLYKELYGLTYGDLVDNGVCAMIKCMDRIKNNNLRLLS